MVFVISKNWMRGGLVWALTALMTIGSWTELQGQAIRGRVVDGDNGDPVFMANVIVEGTGLGVTTDFDGRFRIDVTSLPARLSFSFISYATQTIEVKNVRQEINVVLQPDQILLGQAEVVGERVGEREKIAPLTIETMDVLAIKEAPSGNFYESLGNLKGVDMTSASLGFKIINTRGFNSTSPVRSLQLIDGVDNQSPGLNFSLGNFLGAPDLDVKKVDIIAGASSAFYGPGAFNGVIAMETKSPFQFPGLNISTKAGERSLTELGFRWADYFTDDAGNPTFGYKINAFKFSADDWHAENYAPVDGSLVDASNPGGYNAVNIYGDEYSAVMDFSGDGSSVGHGLGTFYRRGYKESDLVNYDTENLKISTALHLRLQPDQTYESAELIYGFNSGFGTTVYQGDNRFALKDIEFYQHKVELRKPGKWFVRAYRTSEDAGNSYDPYATALRMQDTARSAKNYSAVYYSFWGDSIAPQIADTWPGGVLDTINWTFTVSPDSVSAWYAQHGGDLQNWHNQVQGWAENDDDGLPSVLSNGVGDGNLGYFAPGTPEFEEVFQHYITGKNNDEEGGTGFYDRSSLSHVHAEYIFKPWWLEELRVGSNYRSYTPNSDGTIFSDTAGVVITNREVGFYAGAKRRFAQDKVIVTATVRADKNENFDMVMSPAASVVWTPEGHFLRCSFSSALRNPTLSDQYLYLDVGPATLMGNLNGADSLITVDSFMDYRGSADMVSGQFGLNRDTLRFFDIAPLQPEQVQSIELGWRHTFFDKLYIDASYYFSKYTNFIGYNIGLDALFIGTEQLPRKVDVYRYAANSINTVKTQGASIGLNYYLGSQYMLSGNYSWNELVKTDLDDPIIPAFNTPLHKFNLGFSARDLKLRKNSTWGCGLNYKWVEGFIFEGSPQFTGFVPGFDLLDIQANARIDELNLTVKVGGSNMLNNLHIETYGGPYVGRLAYVSLLFEVARNQ